MSTLTEYAMRAGEKLRSHAVVATDMRPRTLSKGDTDKRARLMGALDEINGRFGMWIAVTASQGCKREWKLRSEMCLPA